MVGREGSGCIHKFCSRMDFELIVYCLETPKLIFSANGLGLDIFIGWKPCGYN